MERTASSLLARTAVRTWVLVALAVVGLYDIAYITQWGLRASQPLFGDFFGFWSFGRFGGEFGSTIYDPVALATYQHQLNASVNGSYPFPYPPTFLLVVVPLGLLSLPAAYAVWIVTTFAAYGVATLGSTWRSAYGFGLLVAPTTLLTITSGQNGLLTAALLVGGLINLRKRPLLAGVLLGLLTYKPQFVLLLPVILLACGSITALLASAVTVVVGIMATSLLFGWAVWPRWIAGFPTYQHLLQANQAKLDHLMPTVLAGMHMLGAPTIIGYTVQGVMALFVAVLCWQALSRGITDRAVAMSIIGSLLVAPYAMIYDTPMIASAVVLHWRGRLRGGHAIGIREITLVIATFACFLDMVSASLPLLAPALMLGLFAVVAFSSAHEDGTTLEQDWENRAGPH